MATVFIALPAYGQTNSSKTTFSLMALAKLLIAKGHDYYFTDWSAPDIAEVRNLLTTIWYDCTNAEWMLQIDADMGFEPQMVMDMLAFGKPVTGCVYPTKSDPLKAVGRFLDDTVSQQDGFVEMEGVGFGVALIHRTAIEAMLEKGQAKSDERVSTHHDAALLAWYGIKRIIRAFDPIETDTGRLGEDLSFCRRHRACGGEVFASVAYPVTHMGQHAFTARFADTLKEIDLVKAGKAA